MHKTLKEHWKFLRNSRLLPQTGGATRLPKVLQFPVTCRCNSRCVMCNCWNMDTEGEADAAEFGRFLADPVFQEIEAAGLNGGEPALIRDFPDIAQQVLKLPKMRFMSIISNGFAPDALLPKLEAIRSMCREAGVTLHVSISLDGVGEVHDTVRAVPNAFAKTAETIRRISAEPGRYCEHMDLGCTVVQQNVERLPELDAWAKKRGHHIRFRLGIDNKRIESHKNRSQYSVFEDLRSKRIAAEFFHSKVPSAPSLMERFTYYSIFRYLTDPSPRRRLGCLWKEDGITLDPQGNLYYCAVASERIGSLRNGDGLDFLSPRNISYRKDLMRQNCSGCIHDYFGSPLLTDAVAFLVRRQFEKRWGKAYKPLARLT